MATYNITYNFKHTLIGRTRAFNKRNQTITLRLSSQADKSGQRSSTFVVQLQAYIPQYGWETVRTASFPRNGMDEVKWTGMPSGDYRLRFEKSTDGIQVIGVGVMSNA